MPSTLVTGGAGYIGVHVIMALAARGRRCVCIDNHCNSSPRAVARLRELVPGLAADTVDIRDAAGLKRILAAHDIDSVIHLAGLKAVGESVAQPLRYYENNVGGTLTLLEALAESSVRRFVFSSSATVYGAVERMPIDESAPTSPQSPYGHTKLMIERILVDLAAGDPAWRVMNLRYFNPVGAHESGRIGEHPAGVPNNVMPFITQVAAGRLERLRIFGNDYPTADGTGVRDYIHVMDLAEGHVAALDALERVTGVNVAHTIVERRPGDIAVCFADASLAKRVLGWEARRGIDDMCRDAWRWQSMNPGGY